MSSFHLWLLSMIFHLGLIWVLAPELPDRIVKQFDFSGRPTSSTDRTSFVSLQLLLPIGCALLCFLSTFWPRMINFPNKAYWLADERREMTLCKLRSYSWYICFIITIFTSFTFLGLYHGNRVNSFNVRAVMPWLVIGLTILLIGSTWCTVKMWKEFRTTETKKQPS